MLIDTGNSGPSAKSSCVDETQRVTFRDWTRADRARRQIIEAIETCETVAEVNGYIDAEEPILSALYRYDETMSLSIAEAAEEHRIILRAGSESLLRTTGAPELTQSQKSQGAKKVFTIDTGPEGGSQGPWITWTSEGSARKGLAPESWVLRSRDDNNSEWLNEAVPAFANGCIVDLNSLKLGWEKDGGQGVAPVRQWNPSVSQSTPRPSEDKKPGGGYVWGKALSVRCAIGDGKSATWEQASFGAYEAFTRLSKQVMAQWGDNSNNGALLPLVKQASVERRQLSNGNTSIPVLDIVDWVARPDCLKDDAPTIATETPAPAASPAPPPPSAAPQPAEAQHAGTF